MSKRRNKHALQGQGFHKATPAFGKTAPVPGVCKICGCTDEQACITPDGPCCWVDEDHTLCSACK